ncbi:hypothetical protein FHW89_000407 [Mucilaginibacter sp. SG564]|nr:hypothetical protein [Mucilaginibacter sp. SG564]
MFITTVQRSYYLLLNLSLSAIFDGLKKNSKQKMNLLSLGMGVKL